MFADRLLPNKGIALGVRFDFGSINEKMFEMNLPLTTQIANQMSE